MPNLLNQIAAACRPNVYMMTPMKLLFIVIYSNNMTKVRLEMENLTEALEIVGTGRIISITKVETVGAN